MSCAALQPRDATPSLRHLALQLEPKAKGSRRPQPLGAGPREEGVAVSAPHRPHPLPMPLVTSIQRKGSCGWLRHLSDEIRSGGGGMLLVSLKRMGQGSSALLVRQGCFSACRVFWRSRASRHRLVPPWKGYRGWLHHLSGAVDEQRLEAGRRL